MNINFVCYTVLMLVAGSFGSFLYIKSCMPAHMEKKIGPYAYEKCARMRYVASLILSISALYFIMYNTTDIVNYQSDYDWLNQFPSGGYFISFLLSVAFLIFGTIIFVKGRKALGTESQSPKRYHNVFCEGIYGTIRHPQHVGEICFWYALAFFVGAPILVLLVTFFWVPMYYLWCRFEEKDLILRYGAEYEDYIKRTKMFIPHVI